MKTLIWKCKQNRILVFFELTSRFSSDTVEELKRTEAGVLERRCAPIVIMVIFFEDIFVLAACCYEPM